MKTIILKLAAERAIEIARFSTFSIRLNGVPREIKIPGHRVTDTTSNYEVEAIEIPVMIGYTDLKGGPIDILNSLVEIPEVPGFVVVTEHAQPIVEADFALLGSLRNKWESA